MMGIIADGRYEGPGGSPDGADAMVWALGELMVGVKRVPGAADFECVGVAAKF